MRQFLILALVTIITNVFWCGVKDTRAEEYESGKAIFTEKCQLCHGPKGDGNGPAASAYNPKPANLTDRKFYKNNPRKKITEAIKDGYMAMPPVDPTADEIVAVIA